MQQGRDPDPGLVQTILPAEKRRQQCRTGPQQGIERPAPMQIMAMGGVGAGDTVIVPSIAGDQLLHPDQAHGAIAVE
ncbi:MAG: hypothetical protein HOA08_10025 [Rhodospirillaceae bacterium]|nr:hypothetical protein [Rhodospirillaceae bacterium]MBT3493646.1 hypothetical protein [Rhodospirillaceae bacterium]MBT3782011.1 hypothetical protein [Rhodospirillaceae bacterium]MBT3978374.1 hypothetical protein [Rhodospirillaceae bacterium]MBT4171379.1 hypothetical protein [Rhodospirillaceae bacterium]